MADKIVITGFKPYDGEYPLDLEEEPLTTREWRWVKKISGYLPLTVEDGFAGADPELVVALAVIALVRNGKTQKEQALTLAERIADLPFDGTALQLVIGESDQDEEEPEADARPPEQTEQTA